MSKNKRKPKKILKIKRLRKKRHFLSNNRKKKKLKN